MHSTRALTCYTRRCNIYSISCGWLAFQTQQQHRFIVVVVRSQCQLWVSVGLKWKITSDGESTSCTSIQLYDYYAVAKKSRRMEMCIKWILGHCHLVEWPNGRSLFDYYYCGLLNCIKCIELPLSRPHFPTYVAQSTVQSRRRFFHLFSFVASSDRVSFRWRFIDRHIHNAMSTAKILSRNTGYR